MTTRSKRLPRSLGEDESSAIAAKRARHDHEAAAAAVALQPMHNDEETAGMAPSAPVDHAAQQHQHAHLHHDPHYYHHHPPHHPHHLEDPHNGQGGGGGHVVEPMTPGGGVAMKSEDEAPLAVPNNNALPPPPYPQNHEVAERRGGQPMPFYKTISCSHADPNNFNAYLFALISFKAEYGNYSVHKDECPNLYAWLSQMKREYARFTQTPNSTTMTAEQRKVLDYLHVPLTHRGDDHWNRFFNHLVTYKETHGHVLVPRVCEIPGLGDWVTDQRRQYKAWKNGKQSQLSKERREKLEKIGFTWQVRNRPEWEQRFAELVAYKKKHGDCKVPQHYKENKALGKWVAKQREQFKFKKRGQHSFLSPDREEKLNSIGFVWQVRSTLAEPDEDPAAVAGGRPHHPHAVLPPPAMPMDVKQEQAQQQHATMEAQQTPTHIQHPEMPPEGMHPSPPVDPLVEQEQQEHNHAAEKAMASL